MGPRQAQSNGKHAPTSLDDPGSGRQRRRSLALSGDYGFGWLASTTCQDDRLVEHSGWEPGYFSSVILLPERHFGIVSFATTHGVQATVGAVELLRRLDALPPLDAPRPIQELERAQDDVSSLLQSWDAELVRRTFAPASVHYEWFPKLEESFVRLRRAHGHCDFSAPITAETRLHGHWRAVCERGGIEFEAQLSPTVPPQLAALVWKELSAGEPAAGAGMARQTMATRRAACAP